MGQPNSLRLSRITDLPFLKSSILTSTSPEEVQDDSVDLDGGHNISVLSYAVFSNNPVSTAFPYDIPAPKSIRDEAVGPEDGGVQPAVQVEVVVAPPGVDGGGPCAEGVEPAAKVDEAAEGPAVRLVPDRRKTAIKPL